MLEFKGGFMEGAALDPDQFKSIARLPALEVMHGQLAGLTASPLTGLVRGLGAMISGLAIALGQIQEKGLVTGEPEPQAEEAGRRGEPPRRGGGPRPRRSRRPRSRPPEEPGPRGAAGRGGPGRGAEPPSEGEPEGLKPKMNPRRTRSPWLPR